MRIRLEFSLKGIYFATRNTGVAQLVEHRSPKPRVGSSNLSSRAKKATLYGWLLCLYSRLMIKLVVFDLDGTLLDSLKDLAVSANYALRLNGFPEHDLAEFRYFVGNGITKLIERALPLENRQLETIEKVRADFVNYYSLHKADYTAPYPGIVDLLRKLRKRDICLAVASNKFQSATEVLVPYYFGQGTFAFVYGQREGIPTKPDPRVVFDILHEAGVQQDETLYVGDSGVDMQTASRAGVTAVGVMWGFRTREELQANGASFIVEHPAEILKLLA